MVILLKYKNSLVFLLHNRMKKILIVRELINGLVRLVKAIRCKIVCCCESECGKQNEIETEVIQSPSIKRDAIEI